MGALAGAAIEGIHPDDSGNIWIVEDVGGTTVMNNGKESELVRLSGFVPLLRAI